jgi:UDP-GlcNAc:undecaprenyl-phosphate GlcNAc-1-phosphate transferase
MFTEYLPPIITSAVLTLLLLVLVKKIFPKFHLMDRPEKYGLKRSAIPYGCGIIIYLNLLVLTLSFLPITPKIIGMLIGAGLITLTGFIDDFRNLSPKLRLAIQLVATVIIILSGFEVSVITNPFGTPLELGLYHLNFFGVSVSILSALFLFFWFLGMINTVNFLDGIPGLVSGITCIAGTVLFLLAIRPGFHVIDQTSLAIIIGITTASAFVFWLFDFHPPKLLMGDAGSTLLGFLLAVFAVFAGGKIATAFIVMGFPIFDVLLTVTRRIIQKKSPLKGDYQHLHHDLLRAGLSERKTVLVIYALSAMFGLTALYLDSYKKLIAIVIIFTIMAILKVWLIQRASRLTSAVE